MSSSDQGSAPVGGRVPPDLSSWSKREMRQWMARFRQEIDNREDSSDEEDDDVVANAPAPPPLNPGPGPVVEQPVVPQVVQQVVTAAALLRVDTSDANDKKNTTAAPLPPFQPFSIRPLNQSLPMQDRRSRLAVNPVMNAGPQVPTRPYSSGNQHTYRPRHVQDNHDSIPMEISLSQESVVDDNHAPVAPSQVAPAPLVPAAAPVAVDPAPALPASVGPSLLSSHGIPSTPNRAYRSENHRHRRRSSRSSSRSRSRSRSRSAGPSARRHRPLDPIRRLTPIPEDSEDEDVMLNGDAQNGGDERNDFNEDAQDDHVNRMIADNEPEEEMDRDDGGADEISDEEGSDDSLDLSATQSSASSISMASSTYSLHFAKRSTSTSSICTVVTQTPAPGKKTYLFKKPVKPLNTRRDIAELTTTWTDSMKRKWPNNDVPKLNALFMRKLRPASFDNHSGRAIRALNNAPPVPIPLANLQQYRQLEIRNLKQTDTSEFTVFGASIRALRKTRIRVRPHQMRIVHKSHWPCGKLNTSCEVSMQIYNSLFADSALAPLHAYIQTIPRRKDIPIVSFGCTLVVDLLEKLCSELDPARSLVHGNQLHVLTAVPGVYHHHSLREAKTQFANEYKKMRDKLSSTNLRIYRSLLQELDK